MNYSLKSTKPPNAKAMRYLMTIVFALTFLSDITAQKNDYLVCTWVVAEGAQVYNIIVGSNLRIVDSIDNNIQHDAFHKYRHIRRYVISENAMQFISRFVKSHCTIATDETFPQGQNFYFIGQRVNNERLECYLKNKSSAVAYFESLISWISKSKYSKECEGIIQSLKHHYIQGKGFPPNKLDQIRFKKTK